VPLHQDSNVSAWHKRIAVTSATYGDAGQRLYNDITRLIPSSPSNEKDLFALMGCIKKKAKEKFNGASGTRNDETTKLWPN
jgi:hypothetical protein